MGGGGKAPPAQVDPNKLAEFERQKSVAISQLYAQKSGYMGTESTDLSGQTHTSLSDFGPPPDPLVKGTKEYQNAVFGARHTYGPSGAAEMNNVFNDYNKLMQYKASKRKELA